MILLTGASGFLGQVIGKEYSGKIISIGRSKSAQIRCDLSLEIPLLPQVELVIHAAGKAHSIPKTIIEKKEFFDVNVQGTQNLLNALEQLDQLPKSFVLISTVAVYGLESGENIKEDHSLDASDPYGMSKIQAERIVQEWCSKNNVICSILRLPLVVGTNPPGNLRTMIKGIERGFYLNIAGGTAKKTMVLAEDVAKILESVRLVGGIYNLSDGRNPSFSELASTIAKQLGKSKPYNIPAGIAFVMAKLGDFIGSRSPFNSNKLNKMTSNLTFDDSKARKVLMWQPRAVLDDFKIK